MKGKVISIVNRKNSSGRTIVSINLAKELTKIGRVLFLDLDPQAESSRYFQVSTEFSIFNIFNRTKDFKDVVQKSKFNNLYVLPSNINVSKIEKNPLLITRILEVTEYLESKFDYIIIETPPYFNSLTTASVDNADIVLIPFKIEKMSLYFLEDILKKFKNNISKIKILPLMYEDVNIEIYSNLVKNYQKNLFKTGHTSIKIDNGEKNIDKKFKLIIEAILND